LTERVVAIIQGRMSSSRLPGKILAEIAGRPMLEHVYVRVRRARRVHQVLFATSDTPEDDVAVAFCRQRNIPFVRGSLYDVLDRYYQAARQSAAQIVVRITADCPLIDPQLIDEVVAELQRSEYDFVCNRLPPPWHRTYPIGLDVEACTFAALERAWKEADQPHQREHVMPYLYEGSILEARSPRLESGLSLRGFRVALLHAPADYGHYRWTVDTAEDLEFVRRIFAAFPGRDDFSWEEVLSLVHRYPQWMAINAHVSHKTLYDVDARSKGKTSPKDSSP
jgi:spore coat polysaccharide biosynthesis protein SpsF